MPHSIGVGATLVALNREAEASPTQFFPASVRHYPFRLHQIPAKMRRYRERVGLDQFRTQEAKAKGLTFLGTSFNLWNQFPARTM